VGQSEMHALPLSCPKPVTPMSCDMDTPQAIHCTDDQDPALFHTTHTHTHTRTHTQPDVVTI